MEINQSIKDLFEPELMEEILAVGKKKTAKEGEVIISIGQRLLFMPIVLQGTVKVSMMQPDGREMLMYYDQTPDLGKNYTGKVKKIMEIGAIVEVLPNVEALVHISQLDTERVAETGDIAKLGDDMEVKIIEIKKEDSD